MKAHDKIKVLASENSLNEVVKKYGVEKIWELTRKEAEDEIFTPVREICLAIMNGMNKN
jgi:hypothetical protein